jgi:[acyl-carrier-protein] S-malonyltransferase
MAMVAFVFPGQGSQHVGMGTDIAAAFPEARETFDTASALLGCDFLDLCRNGPEAELTRTVNAQPAILTVSTAIFRVLRSKGLVPQMAAGLSLGEYSALVAAGSLVFEDAVRLVRARAVYMQEAVPEGEGAMAAIIGLSEGDVRDICGRSSDEGTVEPANFNCPGQIIISGRAAAVQKAVSLARKAGGSGIPLKVSAPFHCSLMQPAATRLKADLDEVEIRSPSIAVFANVSAGMVTSPAEIREALLRQVHMPVLWERSVREMISRGARVFVEVGPGKTLANLIRKIDRTVAVFSVNEAHSLEGVTAWKEASSVAGS